MIICLPLSTMAKGLWANYIMTLVPHDISVSSVIKILGGDGLKLCIQRLSQGKDQEIDIES